jgi:hypothetical protein
MAFTKRHYEEVARIIQGEKAMRPASGNENAAAWDYFAGETLERIQEKFCRMFAADNPRFDGTRFDMACEPKGEK